MRKTAEALLTFAWLGLTPGCRAGAEPARDSSPPSSSVVTTAVAHAASLPEPAAPAAAPAQGEDRTAAEPAEPDVEPAPVDVGDPAKPRFAGGGPEQDFVLEQLLRAKPLSFKAVTATTGVMRMRLAAPFDGAFKPVTPVRPRGPMAEVAAYRIARCLGLDSVPPAITREVPAAEIRAALDTESRQRWPELRKTLGVADDAIVRGAAILWVNDLSDVGLEDRAALEYARPWLSLENDVPRGRRALAASLSTVLAFDYLIGNFDRWSGGNVKGDPLKRRIYVRDHDLAFPARMTEQLHRRLWDDLQIAQRFSRRFYAQVKALSRECVRQQLALDPAGARRLITPRQLAGVFDRREALLSHIDSLIALHGESAVLAFE